MKKLLIYLLLFSASLQCFSQDYDQLWELYSEGEFEMLIDLGKELLTIDENDPELNLLVGRSLVDNRSFYEAIPFLERHIQNDQAESSSRAWALNYLGKSYYAVGNYLKAKQAFLHCIELNTSKNAANSSSQWMQTFGLSNQFNNWRKEETAHFIFYFVPDTHVKDIQSFMDSRERIFRKLQLWFGTKMPKKIDFFIWNSHEEGRSMGFNQIGFAKSEFAVIHSRYNQTLGHEMTHVLVEHSKRIEEKTPFINEGIAVWMDQEAGDKFELAKELVAGEEFSIRELWDDWSLVPTQLSYPIAGAFSGFLLEKGGKEKYIQLLKNQTYESASHIYGDKIERYIELFENSLFE